MFENVLLLPIQSLRINARLMRTYLLRLLFVGIVFVFLVRAHLSSFAIGAPGLWFFESITYFNFVFISLAGTSFFATAITEEKEEGTLGLLKLAGIRPVSLLLGKSTTRLIAVMLLFWAQFPFTLLAITLGGVTLTQVFAAYCALTAYTVLLANVGLFCSVYCKRSGSAATLMLLVVLFLLIGSSDMQARVPRLLRTRFVATAEYAHLPLASVAGFLKETSAYERIDVIMSTGFSESPIGFQVVGSLATALAFFVLSAATFERLTRDHQLSSPPRGISVRVFRPLRRFGSRVAWSNALIWKDFHFVAGGKTVMIGKFVAYGLLLYFIDLFFFRGVARGSGIQYARYAMAAMTMAIALELSFYASRIFRDEVQWKTLPGIMMLPLSTARIAYSKVVGCLLGLLPASVFLLAFSILHPQGIRVASETFSSTDFWIGIVQFVLFLHLATLLSLMVKWGALPLAVAVLVVVETAAAPFFFIPLMIFQAKLGTDIAMAAPVIYLGAISAALFQFLIGRKLQAMAGE